MRHENIERCDKCEAILNTYPGLNDSLRTWFEAVRIENNECHVSSAGRGKIDQNLFFAKGASKARYGESAHNYNCAVDLFELRDGNAHWDEEWFQRVIKPNLYFGLTWYGDEGAKFYELPHVEVSNWKELVKNKQAHLVEP